MQYCTFCTSRFITVVTQKGRTVGPWRLRCQLAVPTGQSLPPACIRYCLRVNVSGDLQSVACSLASIKSTIRLLSSHFYGYGLRSTCPADITLHGQSAFRLCKLQQSFRTVATNCQSCGYICALISTGCCRTTQTTFNNRGSMKAVYYGTALRRGPSSPPLS